MVNRGFKWWLAHEMGLQVEAIAEIDKADLGDVVWALVEHGLSYGVMFVAAG